MSFLGTLLGGAATAFTGNPLFLMAGSGLDSASAAQQAAETQANAATNASNLQYQIFKDQTALQEPFRQGGLAAENRLLTLLGIQPQQSPATSATGGGPGAVVANALAPSTGAGLNVNPNDPNFGKYAGDFSMADFQADPGYAFRLTQGLKALDRQAAARGGLISGAALKAAQSYGQDMASQEYQNAFNRYQVNRSNQLNPLQSLMGQAQTSANTLGSQAGQLGTNVGNLMTSGAAARASGYVGSANAINQTLGQGLNYYNQNQLLNALQQPAASQTYYTQIPSGGGWNSGYDLPMGA